MIDKFKDNAPASKFEGVAAVAALVAIVAAGIALVLFDYSWFAACVIGVLVGFVAALALIFGWREPASGPVAAPVSAAAPVAPAAPKAAAAPVAAPAPAAAPVAAPAAAPADPAPAANGAAEKPTFMKEAREGGPDDLKLIKGVGPKLENTLHGMGIFHFDQIAVWGPAEQVWIDQNLEGFKGRATRDDWVAQAKILAAGGETEFSAKKS